MDWADELADELFVSLTKKELEEDATPFCDRVSTALRKAKANGMREAALMMQDDIFQTYSDDRGFEFLESKFEDALISRANAIEKGTG